MRAEYQSILFQLASSPKTGFELRQQAMQFLSELNGFDWSGIYALKGDMLHLDAYVGAATDHTEKRKIISLARWRLEARSSY
jgi:putative methionine-R-sulfoxide reductase with GAF domain